MYCMWYSSLAHWSDSCTNSLTLCKEEGVVIFWLRTLLMLPSGPVGDAYIMKAKMHKAM